MEHTIIGVLDPKIGFADFAEADVWVPLVLERSDLGTDVRRLFVSGRLAAGVNIANMLLARASGRAREMSVRAALGAGRGRLVRQLLTECFVVSLLAGGLGLAIAWGLLKGMVAISMGTDQLLLMAELSPNVLGFTLLIALIAPIVFGTLPAVRASSGGALGALRDGRSRSGGRSGKRLRNVLVGAQVALALSLMVVAGLLTKTMVNLQTREVGFDASNILTLQLDLPEAKYPDDASQQAFFAQALDALAEIPSVTSVALTSALPGASFGARRGIEIENHPLASDRARPPVEVLTVSTDFFELTGIPVLRGRAFGPSDLASTTEVALLSQQVAGQFWHGEDPVGQRIRLGDATTPWLQIVGIVGDIGSIATNEGRPARAVWLPYAQSSSAAMYAVARSGLDAGSLAGPARAAVWSVDKNQPVDLIQTLEQAHYRRGASSFALVTLFITFAMFALAMAAVGVYGVMSYSVSERRTEIGLRMALGAESSSVRRMVVRQGFTVVALGIVFGLPAALAISRVLKATLYDVSTTDPMIFTAVPAILALVAFIASYIPALRATRNDPMRELRAD